MAYEKSFQVIWANIDANRHLRHTAYNDYAAQLRVNFFTDNGFSIENFSKLEIGPILFREETKFLKEIGMNEVIKVDIFLQGMRKDGSRWKVLHFIYKENGERSAVITVEGAWLDLKARKLIVPPQEFLVIFNNMPKADDFEYIPDKGQS
jgi:acyl-CoA thioester hydrolase